MIRSYWEEKRVHYDDDHPASYHELRIVLTMGISWAVHIHIANTSYLTPSFACFYLLLLHLSIVTVRPTAVCFNIIPVYAEQNRPRDILPPSTTCKRTLMHSTEGTEKEKSEGRWMWKKKAKDEEKQMWIRFRFHFDVEYICFHLGPV